MKDRVVVDASLAVKWLIRESRSDQAIALARSWTVNGVIPAAPYLMPVEVANALHRRVMRKELALETAKRLMGSLVASGIDLRETPRLHGRAMELAHHLRQAAAYDAHYLALAETLQCDLWTADERFYRTASPTAANLHWIGDFRG